MFEKKRKKKHPVEAKWPPERMDTQADFDALVRAKKIEKDTPRHAKVKSLAREKLAERKRRGKSQANIEQKDNTV